MCVALGLRRRPTFDDTSEQESDRWQGYQDKWEHREREAEGVNNNDDFLAWLDEPREQANDSKHNPKQVRWRLLRIPRRNLQTSEVSTQVVPNTSARTQPYAKRLWTR